MEFAETGDKVFAGSVDGHIYAWDMRKQVIDYKLQGHSKAVTGIRLSSDGSFLLSNSVDHTGTCTCDRPVLKLTRFTVWV